MSGVSGAESLVFVCPNIHFYVVYIAVYLVQSKEENVEIFEM